jgi:hypothetical protein
LGKELSTGLVRRFCSAMRTVVIVHLDPASYAQLSLIEILVLVEPLLLFFQAAV